MKDGDHIRNRFLLVLVMFQCCEEMIANDKRKEVQRKYRAVKEVASLLCQLFLLALAFTIEKVVGVEWLSNMAKPGPIHFKQIGEKSALHFWW